jgi:hypothetical protein
LIILPESLITLIESLTSFPDLDSAKAKSWNSNPKSLSV